ncbi:MAG: PAS domain-containing protein [Candidatus Thermoplasmatota archaeon]|nr:PAS domain-containing protein [Candidatus Thermoplasmatota archaeon]
MIGKISEKELEAVLETIPLEFSILDKNDKVLAWNKHETRIFKRPAAAVGRDVRKCHPPKSLSKVEQILSEMKQGKRDMAQFYIDLPLGKNQEKNKVMIQYFALRDKNKNYLGCLEASQNITPIQNIKGEKRLLD